MNFDEFLKALEPYSSIALTAPAGADGDSVGTQCALKEIFESLFPKKTIRIINEEGCPRRYRIVHGSSSFEISEDLLKQKKESPEAWICVDGGASRLGHATTELWNKAKLKAQVDHHALGGDYPYGIRLYDPKAAATVEIVYGLIEHLKFKLTRTLAQSLYLGLIFDTGMFKHSNTKPRTLEIAAKLLETGFNHTETAEKSMMIRSKTGLKILQNILTEMSNHFEGRFIMSALPYAFWNGIGAESDDREGMIDNLFLVEGCEIACLMFEKTPGQWKISFRARGWDVANLAKSLDPNGGGHQLAAGCSLNGSHKEEETKILKAVKALLDSGKRLL